MCEVVGEGGDVVVVGDDVGGGLGVGFVFVDVVDGDVYVLVEVVGCGGWCYVLELVYYVYVGFDEVFVV